MKEKTKRVLKGFCTAAEIILGGAVSYGAYEIGKVALGTYIKPHLTPKNKFQSLIIYGGGLAIAGAAGAAAYKTVKDVTDSISEAIEKVDEISKIKEKAKEFEELIEEYGDDFTRAQLEEYFNRFKNCSSLEDMDNLIYDLKRFIDVLRSDYNVHQGEDINRDEQPG